MVFGVDYALGIIALVAGFAMLAIELAHPGVFLLIPATILLILGLLLIFLEPYQAFSLYGVVLVAIGATCAGILTVPYYKHIAPVHKPMSTVIDSLQGEEGVVLATVVPDSMSGKVRVRSEVWSARSDRRIPPGTRVRVVGGEGVSVFVQPVEGVPAA